MPAPNQEVWGRVDSSLSPTWFQIMTRLRKVTYFILYVREGTIVSRFSVFLTLFTWVHCEEKRKKKFLKISRDLKKNARLPLFCNGPGCETIRLQNTGGVLRVDFSDKISLRL